MSDADLLTQTLIYVFGAILVLGLIYIESIIFGKTLAGKWHDKYLFRRVFWANVLSTIGGLYKLFPLIWFGLFLKSESETIQHLLTVSNKSYFTTYFLVALFITIFIELFFYLIFIRNSYSKIKIVLLTLGSNILTFSFGILVMSVTGMIDLSV